MAGAVNTSTSPNVGYSYAAIDVKHTLVGTAGGTDPDTGDIYRGLDRFGRVKDCYWYDYGSSTDILRIKHGHDRASNRLYREEADTSDLDQLYAYDDVNRLTQSQEGTLGAGKSSISSLNFAQQWSLDATGNWSGFKEDDDGDSTWDLDQTRTSNAVNEITNVTETAGPSWLTPAHNRAGNMTTIPQPGDPTQSYTATYDAWNRLVKLEDGQNTVAEYTFDGAKRLVVRKKYASGSLNQTRHFYHTAQWQTIEERLETGGQIASTADRQFTWGQRYIDDLVCRTVNSIHDYAYQDANWNIVLSSSALARVVYQPYGQIRSTSPAAQGNLDDWQHYFAGYRRDEDTGLYLVRHRVYQPELGCWVQRDPIGYAHLDPLSRRVDLVPQFTLSDLVDLEHASEMHLLRYCGAAPVANTDPFGLHYVPPIGDEPDWVHRDPGPVPNDIGAGDQCRSWAFRTWAWHYRWMDRHGNVLPPYNYGCGGTVAFRANYQYGVVHRKPGTECCNNWTEAVKLLARKQSKGERPLLIGVQSASKANPPLSPPCCGINPTAITGFSNFMSWLGTSKWQAFWEDATGPPSNPNSKVRHCRWHKNGRRTYYCIVPNPHNHSPDVR